MNRFLAFELFSISSFLPTFWLLETSHLLFGERRVGCEMQGSTDARGASQNNRTTLQEWGFDRTPSCLGGSLHVRHIPRADSFSFQPAIFRVLAFSRRRIFWDLNTVVLVPTVFSSSSCPPHSFCSDILIFIGSSCSFGNRCLLKRMV